MVATVPNSAHRWGSTDAQGEMLFVVV
uniref:Uncharacterized protein n=1 Tax=Anguilla anguilla TaxID=7936 RepID=A0A0E9W0M5_ANGAN